MRKLEEGYLMRDVVMSLEMPKALLNGCEKDFIKQEQLQGRILLVN